MYTEYIHLPTSVFNHIYSWWHQDVYLFRWKLFSLTLPIWEQLNNVFVTTYTRAFHIFSKLPILTMPLSVLFTKQKNWLMRIDSRILLIWGQRYLIWPSKYGVVPVWQERKTPLLAFFCVAQVYQQNGRTLERLEKINDCVIWSETNKIRQRVQMARICVRCKWFILFSCKDKRKKTRIIGGVIKSDRQIKRVSHT